MTGYTVHTGSSEKFAAGWDSIFQKAAATTGSAGTPRPAKAAAKGTKKTAAVKKAASRKTVSPKSTAKPAASKKTAGKKGAAKKVAQKSASAKQRKSGKL